MSIKTLNVAILGFGLSGHYLIANYLTLNPKFKLYKVMQASKNTASEIFPSVITVRHIDEIISDKTIDVVVVSTPNETHFEYAKVCLLAGKHVLIEKPMCGTPEECDELMEIAQQNGCMLTVYQNRRFDGDFKTVQDVIRSGTLGKIVNYEARYDRWHPHINPKPWKEVAHVSNGILYDLGAHILDQSLVLFGVPDSYSGTIMTQRANSTIDDAFVILLNYPELSVTLRSSLLVNPDTPRYTIHGYKGSFIKYGVDSQEAMLKAGMMPNDEGFGYEDQSQYGILYHHNEEGVLSEIIPTQPGNYGVIFDNIYDAIVNNKELLIKPSLVKEQIKIMYRLKTSTFG